MIKRVINMKTAKILHYSKSSSLAHTHSSSNFLSIHSFLSLKNFYSLFDVFWFWWDVLHLSADWFSHIFILCCICFVGCCLDRILSCRLLILKFKLALTYSSLTSHILRRSAVEKIKKFVWFLKIRFLEKCSFKKLF
jgi:hypothetical protein